MFWVERGSASSREKLFFWPDDSPQQNAEPIWSRDKTSKKPLLQLHVISKRKGAWCLLLEQSQNIASYRHITIQFLFATHRPPNFNQAAARTPKAKAKPRFRRENSWFQTYFIFASTWGDDPIWLIFFRWVVQPPASKLRLIQESWKWKMSPLETKTMFPFFHWTMILGRKSIQNPFSMILFKVFYFHINKLSVLLLTIVVSSISTGMYFAGRCPFAMIVSISSLNETYAIQTEKRTPWTCFLFQKAKVDL